MTPYATLRSRMIRIALGTSGVGALVLALYFYALMDLSHTQIWTGLWAGALGWALALFVFTLAALRWLDPIERYGKFVGEGTPDPEGARRAHRAAIEFPIRAAMAAGLAWFFGAFGVALFMVTFSGFSETYATYTILGGMSAGIFGPLLAFYLWKQMLRPVIESLASELPPQAQGRRWIQIGVRSKLVAASVALLVVCLTFLSLLIYVKAGQAVRELAARAGSALLERKAVQVEAALAQGRPPESLGEILRPEGDGAVPAVLDESGSLRAGRLGADLTAPEREALHAEGPGWLTAARSGDVVVYRPLARGRGLTLAAVYPWSEIRGAVVEIRPIALGFLMATLFLSILVASFASGDLTHPLRVMTEAVRALTRGEGVPTLPVYGTDELMTLTVALRELGRVVSDTTRGMGASRERLAGAAVEIRRSIDGVSGVVRGIATPLEGAVRETASLQESCGALVRNVDLLAQGLQDGGGTAAQVQAGVQVVAEHTSSLTDLAQTVSAGSQRIAQAIHRIAENVEQLKASAEKTAASASEMNASIKEIESNAHHASGLSEATAAHAQAGMESVDSTIEGIGKIRESTTEVTGALDELVERTEGIGRILGVIDDVADETNLLALNASILAAQAGEAGKGFSVVADEIKDLAERTAQSTEEIARVIQAVREGARMTRETMERGASRVEEGARVSAHAGEALRKILASATESSKRTREIARATAEQAKATRDVLGAMEEVAQAVREIARTTREEHAGADAIAKGSEEMKASSVRAHQGSEEQAKSSRALAQGLENMNEMVAYLAKTVRSEAEGVERILQTLRQVQDLSGRNGREADLLKGALSTLETEAAPMRGRASREA